MDFSELIRKKVYEQEDVSHWTNVLEELARGLTHENVVADILKNKKNFDLVLRSKILPDFVIFIESFIFSNQSAICETNQTTSRNTEEFKNQLINIVTSSDFIDKIETINKISTTNIKGYIREKIQTLSLRDVEVEITPDTQRRLLEKEIESHVEFNLKIKTEHMGIFNKNKKKYFYFESSGIIINIEFFEDIAISTQESIEEQHLTIRGEKIGFFQENESEILKAKQRFLRKKANLNDKKREIKDGNS